MELRAFRRRYFMLNTNEVRKIDSQEYLDRWQSMIVSDFSGKIIPPCDKTAILDAMIQLSHASGVAPKCLRTQDVGIKNLVPVPDAQSGEVEVFKGKVGSLDVMVKALQKPISEDDLKVGLQQALSWQKLDHKNVLPFLGLYYLGNSRTRVCLVYPWTEQGGHLDSAKLQGVADGLAYLHSENIAHSCLQTSSIIVISAGIAYIGDLGLAQLSGKAKDRNEDLYQFGRMYHELCKDEFPGGTFGLHRPLNHTLECPSHEQHEVQDSTLNGGYPQSPTINIIGEWDPSLECPLPEHINQGRVQSTGLGRDHNSAPGVEILNFRPSSGRPLNLKDLARREDAFRELVVEQEKYEGLLELDGKDAQRALDDLQLVRFNKIPSPGITHIAFGS
ncbi:Rho guanine nucleotide exchange factor [Marasmius tenuissimus]|uniref:Rho guanine nucleotide exchange factor n=1 Tax=Marasmius tenuissimus TaxID=585030 RepID=A0ABR2Z9M1_9AGAR